MAFALSKKLLSLYAIVILSTFQAESAERPLPEAGALVTPATPYAPKKGYRNYCGLSMQNDTSLVRKKLERLFNKRKRGPEDKKDSGVKKIRKESPSALLLIRSARAASAKDNTAATLFPAADAFIGSTESKTPNARAPLFLKAAPEGVINTNDVPKQVANRLAGRGLLAGKTDENDIVRYPKDLESAVEMLKRRYETIEENVRNALQALNTPENREAIKKLNRTQNQILELIRRERTKIAVHKSYMHGILPAYDNPEGYKRQLAQNLCEAIKKVQTSECDSAAKTARMKSLKRQYDHILALFEGVMKSDATLNGADWLREIHVPLCDKLEQDALSAISELEEILKDKEEERLEAGFKFEFPKVEK